MSELNVYSQCYYGTDGLFYLKSEADKVIAEKDAAIAELEMKVARAQLVLRLNEPKALFSDLEIMGRLRHEIDVVARRERHQKYKRCLGNAAWCKLQDDNFFKIHNIDHMKMGCGRAKRTFYEKWYKRWLELAVKFKPNNSTAQ